MLGMMLAFLAQSAVHAPLTHDGGVCAGLSWVKISESEKAVIQSGPDFDVYRFHGPQGDDDHWWAVYSGRFASVKSEGPVLLERDGVTVRRAFEGGNFEGYLAEKEGKQNHFFGSIFDGSAKDLDFFDRIDFGNVGQALCARHQS